MVAIIIAVMVFFNKLKDDNGRRNLRDHLVHELKTSLSHRG